MLPKKILELAEKLFKITENNEMKWGYNDELAVVYGSREGSDYEISYDYMENYEEGRFRLKITKHFPDTTTEYYFDARESENGYDDLKKLYDSAQASNI